MLRSPRGVLIEAARYLALPVRQRPTVRADTAETHGPPRSSGAQPRRGDAVGGPREIDGTSAGLMRRSVARAKRPREHPIAARPPASGFHAATR